MANIIEFAINNWWIIIAIVILPTVTWALIPFGYALVQPKEVENLLVFNDYWRYLVKLEGIRDSSGKWAKFLHWTMANKFVRMVNIISLMFIWGYVLLLIGYSLGWLIRLVFVKGLWRLLCAIGRGIAKLYRAI